MNRSLFTALVVFCALAAFGSSANAQFPGLSSAFKRQLATAKRSTPMALPTWVPAGSKVERIHMVLGPKVPIEDRQLIIVYSRQLANGKLQRFAIEAGFDGLGDLMYGSSKRLRTPIGTVYLVYQPKDEDGKKMMDFAMTEWFDVGRTAFHYVGVYGTEEEGGERLTMISLADTERILRSLKRY